MSLLFANGKTREPLQRPLKPTMPRHGFSLLKVIYEQKDSP